MVNFALETQHYPDEAQAQVTVTVEKSGQTVEIMLRSKDLAMRAEKTDERMEDALADAVQNHNRAIFYSRLCSIKGFVFIIY